ncbi:hypothetical protein [Allopontixanthobacter sediminis]|uniref:Thiamine biosynthesis protein ThiC n=1 Tax=Allopontixanthobacter sediminis TaxID=1689985 RepID=A0A845B2Y0_9SPHN|nr:hypothetical protein [Allopontixanthobacter sediminis]MXP45611.1 hypothetical protein [Allopontixanthobacter sediminis]
MEISARSAGQMAALALLVIVVTQALYMVNSSAGLGIATSIIWTIEAVGFMVMAVFAMVALARRASAPVVWASIALGGIFNVIQVGIGLAMFGPLQEAGDASAAAFQAVLAGAFFFYFAGKFLFGIAAIVLGMALLKGPIAARVIAGLAILSGLAAVVLNAVAMGVGMDMVFAAGAAGTAAALFAAIAVLTTGRQSIVS